MAEVKHVALIRFKASTTQTQIEQMFSALGKLRETIPGIVDYSWGPYASPEGLNKGFTHGFVMVFKDAASRDAYLTHPDHEAVKNLVIPELDGGLDGVIVFDWEVRGTK